ncbi:nuclear transport factor 2 family protein [Streptomyces sp. NPDC002588]|uniref:nuclear transport factor 2 family protein n=1 Tax=Streptomyces sp. NPDC002588 TaxID=3154419 RepID=UPI00331674B6
MTTLSDDERRQRAGATVDGLLDALRRHDMKAFADSWAPHGTMEFPFAPPGYPRHESREEVWAYLKDYTEKIDLHEVVERARHYSALEPDTVVLEFEVAGKLVHNGADYNMSYVSVITVGDEGIESYRDHWNSLAIALAMGGAEAFMARFATNGDNDE